MTDSLPKFNITEEQYTGFVARRELSFSDILSAEELQKLTIKSGGRAIVTSGANSEIARVIDKGYYKGHVKYFVLRSCR